MKRGVWIYLGVSVSLSVLAGAYGWLTWKPPTARDTFASILSAVEKRDAERFGHYVDVDAICLSLAFQAGQKVWNNKTPNGAVGAGLRLGRGVCAKATADAISNGTFSRFNASVKSAERVGDATVAVVAIVDGKSDDTTDLRLSLKMRGGSWRVVEVGNLRTLLDKAHRLDKEAAAAR